MTSKDETSVAVTEREALKREKKEKKDEKKKAKTQRGSKSSRKKDTDNEGGPGTATTKSKSTARDKKKFADDDEIRGFFEKNDDKVNFAAFETKKIIGCGSFGMVSLVLFQNKKATGGVRLPPFCLKSVDKGRIIGDEQMLHVQNEYEMLNVMKGNTKSVQLYGVFHDRKYVHYITEFIPGGELFQRIHPPAPTRKGLPIDHARFYFAEVLSVFEYMHARNIVYRDLKPENILIGGNGHVKIVDFGFAKNLDKCPDQRTTTICGTMEYLAPEMASAHLMSAKHGGKRNTLTHAIPVDLWALGIFLYELTTASSPFGAYSADPINMCKAIIKGKITWPEDMDVICKDLIKRCLRRDPSSRIGGDNHPMHLHAFLMEDSQKNPIAWQDVIENKLTPPWKPRLQGPIDTSRFKQPIPAEIQEFGAADPEDRLQPKYVEFFGPMHKHQPPTFAQPHTTRR